MDFLSLSYQSTAPPVNDAITKLSRNAAGLATETKENTSQGLVIAYPNPFAVNTTIAYKVMERTRVQLSLLSGQGQTLQRLVNEVKEPGKYTVNLDGNTLPAGAYFYRLQTGGKSKFGKIIKQ